MTLPALEKTWIHTTGDLVPTPSTNVQVVAGGSAEATNRKVLLAIVKGLLGLSGGAKFVCMGSSNGTTTDAAGTPATSKWITAADLVSNNPGSAHSWIVLAYGDGSGPSIQLLVDLDTLYHSDLRNGVRISISPSAGFTGGDNSNAPTATDETLIFSGGTSWNDNSADVNHRVNVAGTDDRSGVFVSTFAGGALRTFLYLGKAKNPVTTGWTNQWIFWAGYGTTGVSLGGFNIATKIGTTATALFPTGECYFSAGDGTRYTIPGYFTPDDQTGEYPLGPIGLYCSTAGKRGRKGAIFDLFWGLGSNASGDTYPNDGSKQMVQFGHLVLPWDGSNVETV